MNRGSLSHLQFQSNSSTGSAGGGSNIGGLTAQPGVGGGGINDLLGNNSECGAFGDLLDELEVSVGSRSDH